MVCTFWGHVAINKRILHSLALLSVYWTNELKFHVFKVCSKALRYCLYSSVLVWMRMKIRRNTHTMFAFF